MSLTRGGEMSEEKLKPCPFCGGKADAWTDPCFCAWKVFCTECGANILSSTDGYADVLWNNRVVDANKTITCFKCHGKGTFNVPILNDNCEWMDEWESRHCEVCGGTGKITLALYEKWQKRMRGDKK